MQIRIIMFSGIKFRKDSVDLKLDLLQLFRQTHHSDRFQHITDDIVLDGLLGIRKFIEAA